MRELDQAIEQVERLYKSVTGSEPPAGEGKPYAAIPPEKDPERHVEEQLQRLLGMLPAPPAGEAAARPAQPPWTPPVSVWESASEVVVLVDLPGVPRSAVGVSVSRGTVLITGERARPAVNGAGELAPRWIERPFGPFLRAIPLQGDAREDDVRAQMHEGVLEIRIPRAARSAGPRTVTVLEA
jgi:HSP20 family protein